MSRTTKLLVIFLAAVIATAGGLVLYFNNRLDDVLVPVATADKVPTLDKPVAENGAKASDRVLVRRSIAEMKPFYTRLKGRTAPARSVELRAQISGVVQETPAQQGRLLSEGDTVCSLENDKVRFRVNEAETKVAAARLELKKTADLVKDGWKGPDAEASARADVENALADLKAAEMEREKENITAPFDGLFELRRAEIGDFLEVGDACGTLIELNPLLAIVEATEKQAVAIKTDAAAIVALTSKDSGESVAEAPGRVRFVASTADLESGLFRVEAVLENPDLSWRAGQSVEMRIETGEALAHLVKPGAVVRAEDGRLQVRHVVVGNRIKLSDVQVHDAQLEGVWVSGLPEEALIVVEGQGRLPDGMPVDVSIENENS